MDKEITPNEFVKYLEETLIPDLKESGMEATAEDFETAVHMIKYLSKEILTLREVLRRG